MRKPETISNIRIYRTIFSSLFNYNILLQSDIIGLPSSSIRSGDVVTTGIWIALARLRNRLKGRRQKLQRFRYCKIGTGGHDIERHILKYTYAGVRHHCDGLAYAV